MCDGAAAAAVGHVSSDVTDPLLPDVGHGQAVRAGARLLPGPPVPPVPSGPPGHHQRLLLGADRSQDRLSARADDQGE